MPLTPTARAYLFRVTNQTQTHADWTTAPGDAVRVQFNPTTLSYSLQNTISPPGQGHATQYISQSSAKLEFDLLFDSTHDGRDVRIETRKLKEFLNPGDQRSNRDQTPPMVGFAWGTFRFKGIAESFRETLDFFATEGVPLRSTIKLTLAAQERQDIFSTEPLDQISAAGMNAAMEAAANTSLVPVPPGGVNSQEARANGFENKRNPGAAVAAVASAGVQLKAAAGFAGAVGAGIGGAAGGGLGLSAGAGMGLSGGAGIGFGAGAGGGIGFGAGGGGSIGFGAGAGAAAGFGGSVSAGFSAGGSASAGVSASMGAFSGLRTSTTVTRMTPSLSVGTTQMRFAPPAASGEFALGGAAISATSSGLRADVGISARIRFD